MCGRASPAVSVSSPNCQHTVRCPRLIVSVTEPRSASPWALVGTSLAPLRAIWNVRPPSVAPAVPTDPDAPIIDTAIAAVSTFRTILRITTSSLPRCSRPVGLFTVRSRASFRLNSLNQRRSRTREEPQVIRWTTYLGSFAVVDHSGGVSIRDYSGQRITGVRRPMDKEGGTMKRRSIAMLAIAALLAVGGAFALALGADDDDDERVKTP